MIGKELGNYRIIAPIGEGHLGVVYLAEHRNLGFQVALKRFAEQVVGDTKLRQAAVTAARSAAKCRHPNLVTVFDLVDTEDHLAVAMELLEGDSLATHLKAMAEPARTAETWRLLDPVLNAVAYAHAQGVVHGALRPGNLVLARYGGRTVCKVTDLGLPGGLAPDAADQRDADGDPAEWLHYASPEQHSAPEAITPAADIFALGMIFFEALSGTRPFHEGSAAALVQAIRNRRAPGIRSVRPALSHAVQDVISRALELNPAARWPDVAAFAGALESALMAPSPQNAPAPAPVAVAPAPAPVGVAPGPAPSPTSPMAPTPTTAPTAPPPTATHAAVSQPPQGAPQPMGPTAAPATSTPPQPTHYGDRPPRSMAPRPHLGRRKRPPTLKDDPVLTAMEPKSTSRDKWIIAGTVGLCLVALLIAMIVALASDSRDTPTYTGSNSNNKTSSGMAVTPVKAPGVDAATPKGPVAKGVTCATLRGNWTGVFHAGRTNLRHDFKGAVHGTQTACRATFRITTGRQGYVIQYFDITVSGSSITFRGTRVDRSMSRYGYSKDTFVGTLNLAHNRFNGRVRDSKGVIGNVRMRKQ